MKAQGGGSIVNISSIMAHRPQPGNSAYSMAKAAIEGMTRNFAVDLAPHKIRVNVIVPGAINTRYGPPRPLPQIRGVPPRFVAERRRLVDQLRAASLHSTQPWPAQGEARDVADAILFLLSDASRFITGATLHVDGGATAYRPDFWHGWSKDALKARERLKRLFQKYPALRDWRRRKRFSKSSKGKRHG
jgi:NAD(P)-dependent dehydrogenase (short-subunit alcohol dehydrogenase family)